MLAVGNRCKYTRAYSLEAGLFSPYLLSMVVFYFFTSLVFSAHCIVFFSALENILPPLFFSFMASPSYILLPHMS